MRGLPQLLGAAALVVAGATAAGALVVGLLDRGGEAGIDVQPGPTLLQPVGRIEARGTLTPRVVLFADTVTARVDVTARRAQIDPRSLRFRGNFAPWDLAGPPQRTIRENPVATHVRVVYRLRCFAVSCAPPPGGPLTTRFAPLAVSYRRVADPPSAEPRTLTVRWLPVTVHTRLDFEEQQRGSTPWRADLVAPPPASYRVRPSLAGASLAAVAGVFGLAGLLLLYRARPRRRVSGEPDEADAAPPARAPLELAFEVLERPSGANGAADRRRALQLIAAELLARDAGTLAGEARALAWSADPPGSTAARAFARQVRSSVLPPEPDEPPDREEPARDA